MLYTKFEANSYKGLPVNWSNDANHSSLIEEILEEIFNIMNSAVKDGEKNNFRPVLLRFDLESYDGIDIDIDKFIKKSIKYHKEHGKYFKIYLQKEITGKWNHCHFLVIVDGKNDYKSYKKFAIAIQKIWNTINTEIQLYTKEENHYYKIWKKYDFDNAFYASSYLAKFRGKENRIQFRKKKHKSAEERQLTAYDQENNLLRLWDVLSILKISKSNFYEGINKGIYPKPFKLGRRTSVWKKIEIINFVNTLQTN